FSWRQRATEPKVAQMRSAEPHTVVHAPRANGQCPVSGLATPRPFPFCRKAGTRRYSVRQRAEVHAEIILFRFKKPRKIRDPDLLKESRPYQTKSAIQRLTGSSASC